MPSSLQVSASTPLLQRLVAVNAFIRMFIHLCKSCHIGYNVSHLYISIDLMQCNTFRTCTIHFDLFGVCNPSSI